MGLEIKGTKSGFIINADENLDFLEIRKLLLQKFEDSNDFFRGTEFVKFNAPSLKNTDKKYLLELIEESYGIQINIEDFSPSIPKIAEKKSEYETTDSDKLRSIDKTINKIKSFANLNKSISTVNTKKKISSDDLPTKFFFENLRSGSEIEYDGNVVVFGDVNPGAKIIARGNIIVMGTFRGMAHAGKENKDDCFLAALKLLPLQIRIKDLFAVPPDNAKILVNALVRNKDGEIVIESF